MLRTKKRPPNSKAHVLLEGYELQKEAARAAEHFVNKHLMAQGVANPKQHPFYKRHIQDMNLVYNVALEGLTLWMARAFQVQFFLKYVNYPIGSIVMESFEDNAFSALHLRDLPENVSVVA